MATVTVDFPPNCGHCGWQLRPPGDWLTVAALLDTHPSRTPGLDRARAIVDAELARSRTAHPQENT